MADSSGWMSDRKALDRLGLRTKAELEDLVRTRLIEPPVEGLYRRDSLEALLAVVRSELIPRLVVNARKAG
jgi:hypothetical protein